MSRRQPEDEAGKSAAAKPPARRIEDHDNGSEDSSTGGQTASPKQQQPRSSLELQEPNSKASLDEATFNGSTLEAIAPYMAPEGAVVGNAFEPDPIRVAFGLTHPLPRATDQTATAAGQTDLDRRTFGMMPESNSGSGTANAASGAGAPPAPAQAPQQQTQQARSSRPPLSMPSPLELFHPSLTGSSSSHINQLLQENRRLWQLAHHQALSLQLQQQQSLVGQTQSLIFPGLALMGAPFPSVPPSGGAPFPPQASTTVAARNDWPLGASPVSAVATMANAAQRSQQPSSAATSEGSGVRGSGDTTEGDGDDDDSNDDVASLHRQFSKPKRSLTPYNIFFKQERRKILQEIEDARGIEDDRRSGDELPGSASKRPGRPRKRRRGKISFEDLAKKIAKRWKEVDPERLSECQSLAEKDKLRYQEEHAEYQEMKRRALEAIGRNKPAA